MRRCFEYYRFGCSLCNAKTNSEQNFLAHVRGWKHREKAKGFDAKQRKQFEQPTVYKDNSYQSNITVGLSKQYPWFCRYSHLSPSLPFSVAS